LAFKIFACVVVDSFDFDPFFKELLTDPFELSLVSETSTLDLCLMLFRRQELMKGSHELGLLS